MMAEITNPMDNGHETTLLGIAYELLGFYGPLTVEQLAEGAADLGYQINGWEFQAEIEGHLLVHGASSPFIEVGQECYGLVDTRQEPDSPVVHLERYLPAGVALALAAILALSILIGSLGRRGTANSIYLPTTLVNMLSLSGVALAAEPDWQVLPDTDWWFNHPINQMNPETQATSRQYLSNYYNTCGPAVVAMLVSYYRTGSSSPNAQVKTSEVLHEARSQLGYYTPPYNSGLLTFKHLRALLELYGLQQTMPADYGSLLRLDELLERVSQGQPAIVGMRYRYQGDWRYLPAGSNGLYNHFVIVFGLEQVGGEEYLWVANPHPGKYLYEDHEAAPVRMSLAEFWGSWALLDGTENAEIGYAAFFEG
jgi:hypothetical protein